MKTTVVSLNNFEIAASLEALQRIKSAGTGTDTAFRMAINLSKLREQREHYTKFIQGLYRERCQLDKAGEPILNEDKTEYLFLSEEAKAETKRQVKELNESEVELSLYTFPLSLLMKVDIPHTLLEPLLWMVRFDEDAK